MERRTSDIEARLAEAALDGAAAPLADRRGAESGAWLRSTGARCANSPDAADRIAARQERQTSVTMHIFCPP